MLVGVEGCEFRHGRGCPGHVSGSVSGNGPRFPAFHDVDGRDKPGHEGNVAANLAPMPPAHLRKDGEGTSVGVRQWPEAPDP
jgi:hypothetical protein